MTEADLSACFAGELLAIDRGGLARFFATARLRTLAARTTEPPRVGAPVRVGSVGVLPIRGPLLTRAGSFWEEFGLATSYEAVSAHMRDLAADRSIRTIVLDVDSPGGSVSGAMETAALIGEVAAQKRVIAVAAPFMASAAYWLASQATKVVAAPTAMVGSIGAIIVHTDISAALEQAGVKVTAITSSPRKASGAEYAPLDEAGRNELQAIVDHFGEEFERAVARGRGVTPAKVRSDFGGGGILIAPEAKRVGMIDAVGTLDEVVARAGGGAGKQQDNLSALFDDMDLSAIAQILRS